MGLLFVLLIAEIAAFYCFVCDLVRTGSDACGQFFAGERMEEPKPRTSEKPSNHKEEAT